MWHMHKKVSCWRLFNSCFSKNFPWENTNSHSITALHLVVMTWQRHSEILLRIKAPSVICVVRTHKKMVPVKKQPSLRRIWFHFKKQKYRQLSSYRSRWRPSRCSQLSGESRSTPAPEQLSRVHWRVHHISTDHKMSAGFLTLLETPPRGCLNSGFLLS